MFWFLLRKKEGDSKSQDFRSYPPPDVDRRLAGELCTPAKCSIRKGASQGHKCELDETIIPKSEF